MISLIIDISVVSKIISSDGMPNYWKFVLNLLIISIFAEYSSFDDLMVFCNT